MLFGRNTGHSLNLFLPFSGCFMETNFLTLPFPSPGLPFEVISLAGSSPKAGWLIVLGEGVSLFTCSV